MRAEKSSVLCIAGPFRTRDTRRGNKEQFAGTFATLAHFFAPQTDRPWRRVGGPELSNWQLRLATADANAVDRSNRTTNRQHWRAAGTAALIQRDTMPVNVVGGYKFPKAPQIELTARDPQSPEEGVDHG